MAVGDAKKPKLLGYYARWVFENRKSAEYFLTDMLAVVKFLSIATEKDLSSSVLVKKQLAIATIDGEKCEADFKDDRSVREIIRFVLGRLGNEEVQVSHGPIFAEPSFQEIPQYRAY